MDESKLSEIGDLNKFNLKTKTAHSEIHKRSKMKDIRMKGQSNANHKGNITTTKDIGNACGCPRNCLLTIGAENSNETFLDFYNCFSTKEEQDSFISALIDMEDVTRKRPGSNPESRLNLKRGRLLEGKTFRYHVLVCGDRFPVCARAFLSIYALSEKRVRRVRQMKVEGKGIKDLSGAQMRNVLSEDVQLKIRTHICSFPRAVMADSSGEVFQYLSPDLNIKIMYEWFKKAHPEVPVSFQTYWFYFKEHFNLKFGPPQGDVC